MDSEEGGVAEQHGFGPGSVVRLKSGGPAMVISRGRTSGDWLCHWMHEGEAHEASLPDVALVVVAAYGQIPMTPTLDELQSEKDRRIAAGTWSGL